MAAVQQAAAPKMASSSSFQSLRWCGLAAENNNTPGVLRPHPWRAEAGYAHATPPVPCRSGPWRRYIGIPCPSLAVSICMVPGRLLEREAERVLETGEMASAPLTTSLFPLDHQTTPRPIGAETWRVAASLWVYAALFCLVTDALELEFMTSSLWPANRKGSREEMSLPLRLCFLTRVNERARAEGVGEISSRVARMSSEAPPSCLYIKGWRGARRRHFALEWSSL